MVKDGKCIHKKTEPSPKGFGDCAHNRNVADGTDGQLWIVSRAKGKNAKETLRWKELKTSNIGDSFKIVTRSKTKMDTKRNLRLKRKRM